MAREYCFYWLFSLYVQLQTAGSSGMCNVYIRRGIRVSEVEELVRVSVPSSPVQAKKRAKSPCQGCRCNINGTYTVDYTDPDVEIGCRARQRLSRGRKFVPVKPTEVAKSGCKYRL